MGRRLVNELRWSFSRWETFNECQKKYWYIYYGAWEGWPKTPFDSRPGIDPFAARCYMLKQMHTLPTFLGSCVHKVIEDALKAQIGRTVREKPNKDMLIEKGRQRFREGIAQAQGDGWRTNPKNVTNLVEFYYKQPPSDEAIQTAADKVALCIDHWLASPIADSIFHPSSKWLSIEELGMFSIQDCNAIAVVDFAMRLPSSLTVFFDWKTGEETEKTTEQLYSYAVYAKHALGISPESLLLTPFYLNSGKYYKIGARQSTLIDPAKLAHTESSIISACATMASKHNAPAEEFPCTDKSESCQHCAFRELCKIDKRDS